MSGWSGDQRKFPFLLAASYIAFGAIWILLSDRLAALLAAGDPVLLTQIQNYKGWLFIAVTGLGLFLLATFFTRDVAHARTALMEERDFIASVLDTAGALVLVLDPAGRLVRINRAVEEATGFSGSELIGQSIWDRLIPREEMERVRPVFDALLDSRQPNRSENYLLTRDGGRRLVTWSNTVLVDRTGQVRHLIANGVDITRQHQALMALQASEQRFRRLLEGAADAILVADAESGVILQANPRAELLLGRTTAELVGMHQADIHPPEERARYRALFRSSSVEGRILDQEALCVVRADGLRVPVEISSTVIELEGRRVVQGIFRDISERHRVEDQLRRLSRVVETAPVAIMITDISGRIEYCNPRFYDTSGYSPAEVIGQNPRLLKSGEMAPELFRDLWQTISSGREWFGEMKNRRKDGEAFWWHCAVAPIRDREGVITHYVNIAEDISRLKVAESTARQLTYYDPLTNLPNRSLFRERLEASVRSAKAQGEQVALLLVDLDQFKKVNDTLGHAAGDQLIRQVAHRLAEAIPSSATLARLGGDEFAVTLPDPAEAEAAAVARRLLEALGRPFSLQGQEIFVTASIGIALYPNDAREVEELISNADVAMFRVKEVGRNSYHFFTADLNAASFERLMLESELRHALAREQLLLHYQPKVRLADGRLTGMEALVRWQHPELGLVSPGRFIPLAEETGLIVPLGEWVLRSACQQTRLWRDLGQQGLRVAVNLSAQQFKLPDLVERITAILVESDLPGEALELEITESDIMRDAAEAARILKQLKEMGIRLSIDDFGTGYSSLAYLKRFPIDTLKVDQSFSREVTESPDDAAIARAVIALGRSIGAQVVAEGVETRAQLEFFIAESCDEVQGFFLSRPVPPEQFQQLFDCAEWLSGRCA